MSETNHTDTDRLERICCIIVRLCAETREPHAAISIGTLNGLKRVAQAALDASRAERQINARAGIASEQSADLSEYTRLRDAAMNGGENETREFGLYVLNEAFKPRPTQPPKPSTTATLSVYTRAMQAAGVPHEPLQVYDSNSWKRVGLASQYREVMWPTAHPRDGHPDIKGAEVLQAMVAAFNAMLARSGETRDL